METRLICLIFIFAGLLASCDSGQDTINERLTPASLSSIKRGFSTREQVRAILGEPQSVKRQLPIPQPPGTEPLPAKYTASEIWGYWNIHREGSRFHMPFFKSSPPRETYFTAIIYFNERGNVVGWEKEGNIQEKRDN